ncbi:sporulation transcription factor Spo0A [Acidaminobacter sp. JC074]|uniref:sporulation transcription factor Spo0A n=1 Tax=Acidaminobacter sp. JC074 TaxID=2530199 RepID=UPI001F0D594D|nr:sporulation transcription factor Spo0A [Acidaminobacter sp. JC074]
MLKSKSVIIVDDNESLSFLLKENLDKEEGFHVIGMAKDGLEGISLIHEKRPDIVILDMVMPKADGLTVLEKIQGIHAPEVVILSAIGHDIITKRAMSLGAMYYIIKPFEVPVFIDRMNQLFHGEKPSNKVIKSDKINLRLDERITSELNKLGVPLHVKGYHYLKHAITMVAKNDTTVVKITKEVYPDIASKHDTTPSSVERAIRHAIDLTLARGSVAFIESYFNHELFNNKITNKEFILGIVDNVRHR